MIRELDHIEHRRKYTLPYKPEEVQRLYDMRNGRCELVLSDETAGDKPPYSVENFEDFKNKPFSELWTQVTTGKMGN